MHEKSRNSRGLAQDGNVLFIILIAIALFAALIAAFMLGSRSGESTIRGERSNLNTTETIGYADSVRQAIRTMKIGGVKDESFCFDDAGWTDVDDTNGATFYPHGGCADGSNKVYAYSGGGARFEGFIPSLHETCGNNTYWRITGGGNVQDIGSAQSDLVLFFYCPKSNVMMQELCKRTNTAASIDYNDLTDLTESFVLALWPYFQGAYAAAPVANANIGDTNSLFAGKSMACFQDGGENNLVFYQVLLAR